ncbi:MAG TPA: histidine kinase [Jatrophihabitans sp.]|nr:histidine kinase [Jatrophihabitans sp.]
MTRPRELPRHLAMHVIAGFGICAATIVIWAATGASTYFWPRWVCFGIGVVLGSEFAMRAAWRYPPGRRRRLAVHIAADAVLAPLEIAVWALSGAGFFWPAFPLAALAIALSLHVWLEFRRPDDRERALVHRVDVLTRTRRGALDTQAAELRRIERDLHDGAQARLVSLGMSLGLAERLLLTDPEGAAKLLAEARTSTLSALDDLRTVMQAIHPSVLADRGLSGAVQALALDVSLPVEVAYDVAGAAPAPIESAMYFAVAECLANAVKHSHARHASVRIEHRDGRLVAVVADDGRGGARVGAGSGLSGVAARLEAFDGELTVLSPGGGPTVVTLEVPCELSSARTLPSSETD